MADIPQVFISSTYLDNAERREVVTDALSRAKAFAWGMERFTANARPTVAECLRHVGESDVFVLILAHRYGWIPSDKDCGSFKHTDNRSITELEYDEAKRLGKPCLVFMRDEPVVPEDAYDYARDCAVGRDVFDMQRLLFAFKRKVSSDQSARPFKDASLGVLVMQAIQEWRAEVERASAERSARAAESAVAESATREAKHGGAEGSQGGVEADGARGRGSSAKSKVARDGPAKLQGEIDRYVERLASQHESIALAGFETKVRVPVRLDDLYVPLRAVVDIRSSGAAAFADAADAHAALVCGLDGSPESAHERGDSDFPLADAFEKAQRYGQRRGLAILGDPGSGKTTQHKRMLLAVARRGAESIGLPRGCVPVFLPLRELAESGGTLDTLIRAQLESSDLDSAPGFAKRLLERDNLLLLIDGLDEVSSSAAREEISRAIERLLKRLPKSRIVVTCRYAGYTDKARLNEHFLELHVRPFTREQSEEFIHRWFEIVETTLADDVVRARSMAREQAHELVTRLREPEFRAARVLELTRNPLLLTAICLVHRDRGRLPERRGKLYHECVRVLLELWRGAKRMPATIDTDRALRVLQPLALHFMQRALTRATAAELEPILAPILRAIEWKGGGAREFLATIRDESGLLTGWSGETYGFMHLGFQEYLAALEIRARCFDDPDLLAFLGEHFGESWWQELTLLLAALEQPSVAARLFQAIFARDEFTRHTSLLDICISEALEKPTAAMLDVLEQPFEAAGSLTERQLALAQAMQRNDLEIGTDPRKRLARHPDARIAALFAERAAPRRTGRAGGLPETIESARGELRLLLIPASRFTMGSTPSQVERWKARRKQLGFDPSWVDCEAPAHDVDVRAFYLAPTPVTNEQYARFMKANSGIREPSEWSNRKFNQPKQSVVGVSWDEARAYCEWAGLRLPTEAEWECACRAGTSTAYWSGDDEAALERVGWYLKNAGGDLHVVGEKPANAYGLHDMHGNVWEWCEDTWHDSYNDAPKHDGAWVDEASEFRVIRGGSFRHAAERARSAFRHRQPASARWVDLGFRPARSSLVPFTASPSDSPL